MFKEKKEIIEFFNNISNEFNLNQNNTLDNIINNKKIINSMIVQFLINFVLTTFLLVYYLYKVNFHNLFDKNPSGFGSKKTKTAAGLIFSIILLINLIYFFLIILFLIFYQTDFIYLFYQFFY